MQERFIQLGADIVKLWGKYGGSYLTGMRNTLVLALVATLIGCVIAVSYTHLIRRSITRPRSPCGT